MHKENIYTVVCGFVYIPVVLSERVQYDRYSGFRELQNHVALVFNWQCCEIKALFFHLPAYARLAAVSLPVCRNTDRFVVASTEFPVMTKCSANSNVLAITKLVMNGAGRYICGKNVYCLD